MTKVLTIAGSDSSGGAGIQADLRAIGARGCMGITAITAITAQSPDGIHAIHPVEPAQLRSQLEATVGMGPHAIKTGMLVNEALVFVVVEFLEDHPALPVVVDPVRIASAGGRLLDDAGWEVLRRRLLPMTTVLCPNAQEAGVLLGRPVRSLEDARRAVRDLSGMGPEAIVLKGGHLESEEVVDLLWDGTRIHEFSGPRSVGLPVRGTGCIHASTLASFLARGLPLVEAVSETARTLCRAIERSRAQGRSHVSFDSAEANHSLLC